MQRSCENLNINLDLFDCRWIISRLKNKYFYTHYLSFVNFFQIYEEKKTSKIAQKAFI